LLVIDDVLVKENKGLKISFPVVFFIICKKIEWNKDDFRDFFINFQQNPNKNTTLKNHIVNGENSGYFI
jgi:hypothetical protein